MNVIVLVAGIVAGGLAGGILVWSFLNKHLKDKNRELKEKEAELRDMGAELASSKTALEHKMKNWPVCRKSLPYSLKTWPTKSWMLPHRNLKKKAAKACGKCWIHSRSK